jgi:hypothetical protein
VLFALEHGKAVVVRAHAALTRTARQ